MTNIISTILSLVILLIIVAGIYFYRKHNKEYQLSAAQAFLNGLKKSIEDKMNDILTSMDLDKYDSFLDAENDLLNQIDDAIWNYVKDELDKAPDDDKLSKIAAKVLTKELVKDFVDELLKKWKISERLSSAWDNHYKKSIENAESDHNEYNDESKYYESQDSKPEELPPVQEVKPSEEELSKLNPRREDEESYNPKDSSMEIVEDNTEEKSNESSDDEKQIEEIKKSIQEEKK